MASRVPLGELLVEAQIITPSQLEQVLELQKRDGRRLGTLLVESGLVTETQVTQVLSQQLSVPWVSLYHIDFSRQLLDLIPAELAERYCLVPIFMRRVRDTGDTLYVAMDDPTHEEAREAVARHTGLPVRAMIAPPADIRTAIRIYYGARARNPSLAQAEAEVARRAEVMVSTAQPSVRSSPEVAALPVGSPPPVPSAAGDAHTKAAGVSSAAPSVALGAATAGAAIDRETGAPELQALAAPPERNAGPAADQPVARSALPPTAHPGKARHGRDRPATLTLLDGTRIYLQASVQPEAARAAESEAEALIASLRAMGQRTRATEASEDRVNTEALLAALLSVLLRKQLVAEWELLEEYRKR